MVPARPRPVAARKCACASPEKSQSIEVGLPFVFLGGPQTMGSHFRFRKKHRSLLLKRLCTASKGQKKPSRAQSESANIQGNTQKWAQG